MKSIYSISVLSMLLMCFQVTAQNYPSTPPLMQNQAVGVNNIQTQGSVDKTIVNCGSDTVRYVRLGKATDFIGITMNVPSEFAGYSQYYDAPQEINVSGMVFYAGINSVIASDTAIVKCRVFAANPDSTLGAVLTEKDIVVYNNYFPSNIDVMKYIVEFDSVAICNQPYYVSIWTETALPLGIMTDDYNVGDGQNEELAYWYWTGDSTWYPSGEFFVWDVDWLIEPIADYVLEDSLTLTTNSICVPDFVCGIRSRSPIFENRMYSMNAFNGTPELSDSFDWGDGNTTVGNDTCNTYTSPGLYTITYTASLSGWTSLCSVSSVDTLLAGAAPNANFSYTDNLLSVDFTNTSTGALDSLVWDFGDGNGSSTLSPTYGYATSGTYIVCMTIIDACGTDTFCDTVVVTCPNPSAGFTSSVSSSTVSFTDGSAGNNINSWAWDFGDSNTSTQSAPSYTYAADGDYYVCLTITDDCGSNTYCDSVTINTLGISTPSNSADQVRFYPNPSTGNVTLAVNLNQAEDLKITINDANGRVVFEKTLEEVSSVLYPINLEQLEVGTYYMNFESSTLKLVKPLIISGKE